MVPSLIKYFNCVAVKPDELTLDPRVVNFEAVKCGYLVHPSACTEDVMEFLKNQKANYNTTFYESWAQVDSLDEAQMYVLQLIHYLTTYGTDYQGETFTMNDFPEEMRYTTFKILMPCSEHELFERIAKMLTGGIALRHTTLKPLLEQLAIYRKEYGWKINPSEIKNREARALLYFEQDETPNDPIEIIRIIMCATRGNAVIINDAHTREALQKNFIEIVRIFKGFDEKHLEILASVFYRYKKIFLWIRNIARRSILPESIEVIKKINRIRRLAPRFHRPFRAGVMQTILQGHPLEVIEHTLKEEKSLFQLVRILNYLNAEKADPAFRSFVIRNGKVFITRGDSRHKHSPKKVEDIRRAVKSRINELLAKKSFTEDGRVMTIRFPNHLELAAPVSEKMFIGAIPYGSFYRMGTNNYIGVYWRNEWGTRDFDLWMIGEKGERIGWAGNHKKENILFSGDMTNAEPEATEMMYCRGKWPNSTIRVVRYNGEEGSTFRMFFGSDTLPNLPKNYMVNPDSIHLQEDLISDQRETTVGIIHDNTVYFAALGTSDGRLPSKLGGEDISFDNILYTRVASFTPLRELLLDAGFEEYDEDSDRLPDIDLTGAIDKDILISLMTVEQ